MRNVDILLIDESRLFREGLKPLLAEAGFAEVGEAESIEEGLKVLGTEMTAKVVLVDFDTAKGDLATLQRFREEHESGKLVMLAADADDVHSLARCFEAGADAYLLKTISPAVLGQSLQLVLLGEKVFPTQLAALLVKGVTPRPATGSPDIELLSSRENQILRCLLNGHPNKVIAKTLNITEATVKVHLKGVLKKIQAANRTQAAIWALNNGLSSDDTPTNTIRRPATEPTWRGV